MLLTPSSETGTQAPHSALPSGEFPEDTLVQILGLLYELRGLDFRRYRRGIVRRRVEGRMRLCRLPDAGEYLELLRKDVTEVDRLIDYVTIKVSRFFRNAAVFDLLGNHVLPERGMRRPERPLNVWSAGCGRGEEPYSLAILLEELSPERVHPASRICATDIDRRALESARRAIYAPSALVEVTPDRVSAHFIPHVARKSLAYEVRDSIRSRVEFSCHDLVAAAAPPSPEPFDLICCRNVLIYLDQETVEKVQYLLCASLVPGGYLCLGEAEWPCARVLPQFEIVDRRARLFRRREET